MVKSLKSQVVGYLLSGILATGTDFICYNIITHYINYFSIAKAFTFLLGTVVAFFYNKTLTFNYKGSGFKHIFNFFILYILSMCLNVIINQSTLYFTNYEISPTFFKKTEAFIFATSISMIINFFGQKFWVFKKSS